MGSGHQFGKGWICNGGVENEDHKKLGDGIWTVAECWSLAKSDNFCGNTITMEHQNSLRCFCTKKGKEQPSCRRMGKHNWSVYSLNPGTKKIILIFVIEFKFSNYYT